MWVLTSEDLETQTIKVKTYGFIPIIPSFSYTIIF